ncbi:MAG: ribose 5-phosphate isomerase B [Bacteroidetes bacterium]|nr:ribose 5-phosphate isomerase B [Bacteroidota bacterium]
MILAIGSDHAGFELKTKLIDFLNEKKIDFIDKGCFSNERADYPDYGHAVANSVINNEVNFGILICGSGNGINITANKHNGIRAALCWNTEIAKLARQHNNANILSLPGRFISVDEAQNCIMAFITEKFEGGRHADRINKIEIL